jgi:ribosomal protein S8
MNLAKNSGNAITNNSGFANIGDNAVYNFAPQSGLKQRILKLLQDQSQISGYLSSLEVYTKQKTEHETVGLSAKFESAGFSSQIEYALEQKEKFVKHLVANMYAVSYQKILNLLIEEAISTFQLEIYPIIDQGADHATILREINNRVFSTIHNDTPDMDCEFNRSHIEGLIFYITGNCFLRWRKQ